MNNIKLFDLKSIDNKSCVLIIGESCSMKSLLCKSIISIIPNSSLIIFTTNYDKTKNIYNDINPNIIFSDIPNTLLSLTQNLSETSNNITVVFDHISLSDYIDLKGFYLLLFFKQRYNINILIVTDAYITLKNEGKELIDYVIITNLYERCKLRDIWNDFGKIGFNEYLSFINSICKNNQYCLFKIKSTSSNISDFIFILQFYPTKIKSTSKPYMVKNSEVSSSTPKLSAQSLALQWLEKKKSHHTEISDISNIDEISDYKKRITELDNKIKMLEIENTNLKDIINRIKDILL